MFSRRIKMTAIGILFFLTAVLSTCGYIFEIFEEVLLKALPESVNNPISTIADLFTTVSDTFSAHSLAFSLCFIGIAVLDDLYYAFKYGNLQNDLSVRVGKYVKYLLMSLNILCCIDLLNTEGIRQKLDWLQGNKKNAILIVVITVVYLLFVKLLQKNIAAKHEQDNIHQIIRNNPNGINKKNTPISIIQHPFAYAYETLKVEAAKDFVNQCTANKAASNPTQNTSAAQNTSATQNTSQNKFFSTQIFDKIMFSLVTLLTIAFIFWGVRKNDTGKYNLIALIDAYSETTEKIFFSFNKSATPVQESAVNFLLSIGAIILLIVVFFVIIYGFTFVLKMWRFMFNHIGDDDENIELFNNSIQQFFSDSVAGVLRLLLFIPDFLETIQIQLLDSDVLDTKRKP